MNWSEAIDIYCERLSPAFWAEPWNAWTNAAFLIAAIIMIRRIRRAPEDGPLIYLAALVLIIGIGSFLFHTFATRWAALADVIPIAIFILSYFFVAMRRFFDLGLWWALGITVAFQVVSFVLPGALDPLVPASPWFDAVRSSLSYVPAFLALLVVGVLVVRRTPSYGGMVLAAAFVFAVSLTFRSLDLPICGFFPTGTHFLWHLFNALTLYLLLEAARRAGQLRHGTAT